MPPKSPDRLLVLSLAVEEAITNGRWDELLALLDARDAALDSAAAGLSQISESELVQIRACDVRITKAFAGAKAAFLGESRHSVTQKQARSAYSSGASRDW